MASHDAKVVPVTLSPGGTHEVPEVPAEVVEKQEEADTQRHSLKTPIAYKEVKERKPLIDPTGKLAASLFQIAVFVFVNFIVAFAVFFWPNLTEYKYWRGAPSIPGTLAAQKGPYAIHWSLSKSKSTVKLDVFDKWDGVKGTAAGNQVYATSVFIGTDRDGDPGWILQDILDLPRNRFIGGVGTELRNEATQARLIEDLRVTTPAACTGALPPYATAYWVPAGSPTGRCGLDRLQFINSLDGDWDQVFGAAAANVNHRNYGGFGFSNVSIAAGNPIETTAPTGSRYLCNMGRRRVGLGSITIKTRGCQVQIQSTAGDGYEVWLRQKAVLSITGNIFTPIARNVTSGCRGFDVEVDLYNPSCPRANVPGIDESCEEDCVAILYKGDRARRVPIIITPDPDPVAPKGSLLINDRHLVLNHGRAKAPWQDSPQPALQVNKGNIDITLANARIESVGAATNDGTIKLSNLRYDGAVLISQTDDVINEDSRDLELLYRSAAQLLCLASPLVEEVPTDLPTTQCKMAPADAPHKWVHLFYDTIVDGFIDRSEFAAGMARLGLDFQDDSLKLNPAQQARLYDHVFSMTNIHAAAQSLTYDLFQEQLNNIAPYFSTLYDTNERTLCLSACKAAGTAIALCAEKCTWACKLGSFVGAEVGAGTVPNGAMEMTDSTWGLCDPAGTKPCVPSCGIPDVPIDGYSTTPGEINYHYYDVDPPDGIITYQEMRQALLKIYGNCTYVIEPNDAAYSTCRYIGGGQFDALEAGEIRRECTVYDNGEYDKNKADWRYNNEGLAGFSTAHPNIGVVPKECRPFPDYDPLLNGKQYDPACITPECFLPDKTRVPPQYYNRATWTSTQHAYVLNLMQDIFRPSVVGSSFRYFNMSDDDQYRTFGSKMFAEFVIRDRVPYDVFNANLETLSRVDGVGENFYLFNPGCYKTKFQKIRPWWSQPPQGYSIVDEEELEQASVHYESDRPTVVDNTNMPGYLKNADPTDVTPCMDDRPCLAGRTNPCPWDYGDGTVGSARFPPSNGAEPLPFKWFPTSVNSSSYGGRSWGSKWGKALPPYCMDEAWPSGGDPNNPGYYPNTEDYSPFAGQPIPPGCEPQACKPLMKANVIEGSVHSQVLPFNFDWSNATGHYQTMVNNCSLADGSVACFFKGFDAALDNRMRRADIAKFTHIRDVYAPKNSPYDSMVFFDIAGAGVPNKRKWMWSSRPVYTEMEPAWVNIMSGGILGPDLLYINARKSPGYCDINYGAVEHIDWSSNLTYGQAKHATAFGLRMRREFDTFQTMYNNLIPAAELVLQGAFVIKNVWRTPFKNESLFLDSSTSSPLDDTSSDYTDADTAETIEGGKFFEHKAACILRNDGCERRIIWRDNCLVQRDCVRDPATGDCQNFDVDAPDGSYQLTPCIYPLGHVNAGKPAWTNNDLADNSPCVNFTEYKKQFPRSLMNYHWSEIQHERGPDTVSRQSTVKTTCTVCAPHFDVGEFSQEAIGNISSDFYDKRLVRVSPNGDYASINWEFAWLRNPPLLMTIVFSLIIATLCGVVGAGLAIWLAVRKLDASNERLQEKEKMEKIRKDLKRLKLHDAIELERKRQSKVQLKMDGMDPEKDLEPSMWKADAEERKVIDLYSEDHGWLDNAGKQVGDWDIQWMRNKYLYAVTHGEPMPNPKEKKEFQMINPIELIKDRIDWVTNQLRTTHADTWWAPPIERSIGQITRTIIFLFKIFQLHYPSPFEVANLAVVSQLRTRLINSLKTFIKVRCVTNSAITENDDIRLGGARDEIGEFSDVDTARVIRLGVDYPVGIAKTIYGRLMRYKVKWVTMCAHPRMVMVKNREGEEFEAKVMIVKVVEGPCIYVGKGYHTSRGQWEDNLPEEHKHPNEKGREYELPVCHHVNGEGGCCVNYVIQAAMGTRTFTVNTMGITPHMQFKTLLRNFSPVYEKFCLETDLLPKKVLKSEASLRSDGIIISKRMQEILKGLRMMNDDDRAARREYLKEKAEKDALLVAEQMAAPQPARLTVEIPVTCRVVGSNVSDLMVTPNVGLAGMHAMPEGGKLHLLDPSREGGGGDHAEAPAPEVHGTSLPDPMKPIEDVTGYSSGSILVLGKLSDAPRGMLDRRTSIKEVVDDIAKDDEDEDDSNPAAAFLENSDWPVAQFIKSQYVVTHAYGTDQVELSVFASCFKKWCTRQKIEYQEVEPEELALFDIRVDKKPFYDVFGVAVNEVSQSKSVASANKPMFYLLRFVEVLVHCLILWVIPYPLIFTVFWQQKILAATTAIHPAFTTDTFRETPTTFLNMYMPLENRVVLWICFYWLLFGYFKLFIFYAFYKYDNKLWRVMLKSFFYLYLMLLVSMTISLVFLIMTWCILGAIIKPDSFLPYAVASLTLVGHAKATYKRVKDLFLKIKEKIAAAVAAIFALKVAAALSTARMQTGATTTDEKPEPFPLFRMHAGPDAKVSYEEFCSLLDRFDVDLIDDKRLMLFNRVDRDGSGFISFDEFEEAWRIIQDQITEASMEEQGITRSRLMMIFIYAIVILCLIFAFIFTGVAAFVGVGTLGALVNSALTAFSGLAMHAGQKDNDAADEDLLKDI